MMHHNARALPLNLGLVDQSILLLFTTIISSSDPCSESADAKLSAYLTQEVSLGLITGALDELLHCHRLQSIPSGLEDLHEPMQYPSLN